MSDLTVKDEGDFANVTAHTDEAIEFVDAFMPVLSAIDEGRVAIDAAVVPVLVREAEQRSLSVELE